VESNPFSAFKPQGVLKKITRRPEFLKNKKNQKQKASLFGFVIKASHQSAHKVRRMLEFEYFFSAETSVYLLNFKPLELKIIRENLPKYERKLKRAALR